VLTGEMASDRGVRPRNNFDPAGHWGAFQILGRLTELKVDPQAFDAGFAAPGQAVRRNRSRLPRTGIPTRRQVLRHVRANRLRSQQAGARHPENAILFRSQLGF
jgi:formylglycine-generating enzyme required for sulfatase activity